MRRTLIALAALLLPLLWIFDSAPAAAAAGVRKALRVQERLLKRDPANARLLNDLGNLQLTQGNEAAAEESYRRALEVDPELVSARFNLSLLLQQQGHYAKARRGFSRVLKVAPEHAWAHYQIGILHARRGSREKAIEHFAVALRNDRRLTDPAYNPHILDNSLAPTATLRAYADLTSIELVPRTYEDPRRIVEVLVPELEEDGGKPSPARPLKPRPDRKKPKGERRATPADDSAPER